MLGYSMEKVDEFNPVNLVEIASKMPSIGLDTESSGPLLLKPQLKKATKTLPARLDYKNFIDMTRSTTTGFSLAFPNKTSYYVPLNHSRGNAPYHRYVEQLRKIVTLFPEKLAIHNLKHELQALQALGINLQPDKAGKNPMCTLVAAHVTHTRDRAFKPSYGLKALSAKFLDHTMSEFDTVVGGQGKFFATLDPNDSRAVEYACEDAVGALLLAEKMKPRLKAWGLEKWFYRVEMPFVWALLECTQTGISLDKPLVQKIHTEALVQLEESYARFYELTGANCNSPKQMQILFEGEFNEEGEQVRAPIWPKVGKKGKSGWSTSAEALAEIENHLDLGTTGEQAMEALHVYRDVQKVVSTYSQSLLRLAGQYPDGKLHPDYLQHGTQTYRISSSYPNGQNQASRGPIAKKLMEMYRAPEGEIWLSADYSQIDLRVLAHHAKGSLMKGFIDGKDAHQATADAVGITRDDAKTVNFARVYGAQAKKLSKSLGCTVKEAKAFMAKADKLQPKIPEFFQKVRGRIYERGYIKSLSGLRRAFPQALRRDYDTVQEGFKAMYQGRITEDELFRAWSDERQAGNMVCQGGAGDIVKKAMVDLYFQKPDDMLFQVQIHDDIRSVILGYDGSEHAQARAEELAKLKQDVMESAWKLRVPLVAEPVLGFTWKELKG